MGAPRYAQKKDGNQAEIVDALRDAGFYVYVCHQPTDLIVGRAGQTCLVEVKRPKEKPRSPAQVKFLSEFTGACVIVTTPDNAIQSVVAALRITPELLHGSMKSA